MIGSKKLTPDRKWFYVCLGQNVQEHNTPHQMNQKDIKLWLLLNFLIYS